MVVKIPYKTYIGNGGPKILAFGLDGMPRDSEGVGDVPNRGKVVQVGIGFGA